MSLCSVSLRSLSAAFFLMLLSSCAGAHAQPGTGKKPQSLPKKNYKVCGHTLSLEIADNDQSRTIGLMHRTGVPAGTGMLFSFSEPRVLEFWMRNVPFDIGIGFFDSKGHLITSMNMAGTSPLTLDEALPRYSSEKEALFAVETPKNFFASIKKDALARCQLSPLPPMGR